MSSKQIRFADTDADSGIVRESLPPPSALDVLPQSKVSDCDDELSAKMLRRA